MSNFTLVSVISAQQQADSKFGIIASLQNGKDGKPAWKSYMGLQECKFNFSEFNATFNIIFVNSTYRIDPPIVYFIFYGINDYIVLRE